MSEDSVCPAIHYADRAGPTPSRFRCDAPILAVISNGDGDGNYTVDWSDVLGATSYTLQEDDNAAFTSPATAYTGAASTFDIVNQNSGTWYYRVLATCPGGDGDWSNTESVDVTRPE
jgi:hypothetical protein